VNERFDHATYLSRFTWRYGSKEMRQLFSELEYRRIWREIWCEIARVQSRYGLVSRDELSEILDHKGQLNIARSHEIERRIKHDVMAELKAYAAQCPKGGGKIHLGATSADITDNADVIQIRKALSIILQKLLSCLKSLRGNVLKYADLPCIGWTHLQPAEPTTIGYRFANYAQDLVMDVHYIDSLIEDYVYGKGIKGAVGTSASFATLLGGRVEPIQMEKQIMRKFKTGTFPVTAQTYPRKVDFLLMSALASVAQSAHKFGFDVRLLQSPAYGELSEPFVKTQVGSSTMPFKRNPIYSERMCSLARYVSNFLEATWTNAADALLERTLDDSASRHLIIPESFLATDEILTLYNKIIRGIEVHVSVIKENLKKFGKFAGTEAVLMKLVQKGADRQEMHELIRRYSIDSWKGELKGEQNQLPIKLKNDSRIASKLEPREIDELLDPTRYIGDAPDRCKMLVKECIDPLLEKHKHMRTRKSDTKY
jgi:adenylosuccinate lyase